MTVGQLPAFLALPATRAALPRALCFKPASPHAARNPPAHNESRPVLRARRQERHRHLTATGAAARDESASEAEAPSSSEASACAVATLAADTFLRSEITIGIGTGLAVSLCRRQAHAAVQRYEQGWRCHAQPLPCSPMRLHSCGTTHSSSSPVVRAA